MSIKHFILIPLALSGTALIIVLMLNGTILSSSLERIDQEHQMNVQGTVKSLLDSYRLRLSVLSKEYEKHNELGERFGSFAVTGKRKKIEKTLEKVAVDSDVDFSNMVDLRGASSVFPIESPLTEEIQKLSSSASSGTLIRLHQDRVVLLSYSPVYLFGEQEGILVLGYYVNPTLLTEIQKTTSAQVDLIDSPGGNVKLSEYYSLNVESSSIRHEEQKVFSTVVIAGIACFILLNFGMYWLLSKAFGKSFEKVIQSFHRVVKGIEDDEIVAPEPTRHPIREISDIHGVFRKTVQSLVEFQTRLHKRERDKAFVEVAEEVLHDLRAPMKALDKQMKAHDLPDGIRDTFTRVQKIMLVLRREKRIKELGTHLPTAPRTLELIPVVIDMLVDEKTDQYSDRSLNINFEPIAEHVLACSKIDRVSFERAISNLIDNAADAVEADGQVDIHIEAESNIIRVTVSDNGKGISEGALPHILKRGFTFGKEKGSGLGLWYANKVIKEHGGQLSVSSKPGFGTQIIAEIPRTQTPTWMAEEITIPPSELVIILDDDESVHHLWEDRLAYFKAKIFHFHDSAEFLAWRSSNPKIEFLFLCDYQIHGSALNGIECLQRADTGKKHLVTEFYGREDIIEECIRLGFTIVPKPIAHLIKVHAKGRQSNEGVVA